MNNWRFHSLYIALIGVLGYQVGVKYRDAYAVSEVLNNSFEQLKNSNHIIDTITISQIIKNINTSDDIFRYSYRNIECVKKIHSIKSQADSILVLIDRYINGSQELKEDNIENLEKNLWALCDSLQNIKDISHKKELEKRLTLPTFLNKNPLNALKNKSFKEVKLGLTLLQSPILQDLLLFINYYNDLRPIGNYCGFSKFSLAFQPFATTLFEGERMESAIFIKTRDFSIPFQAKVNGQNIMVNEDGMAHFKLPKQSVGEKSILAEAIITDPFSGDTTHLESRLKYYVLPSCSRKCQ